MRHAKWNAKLAVDVGMMILMPLQMTYLPTGQRTHEWSGSIFLILIRLHLALNAGWLSRAKGHRAPTLFSLRLCMDIACLAISGVMMSRYVFAFLPLDAAYS